ncbi:triosephosphate isomerase [uncultured archaeon]|nr:triosephosphate isomerase [uncultured archaeon]
MEEALVVVNFKNYSQSTLDNSRRMLDKFSKITVPQNVRLAFAISPVDLCLAGKFPDLNIFSQHADENDPGAATGKMTIEGLTGLGIKGSLLNHSENRVPEKKIAATIGKAGKSGFEIILCVGSPEEAEKYAPLRPSYIAYEPPELIGGDISVSTARPEIISDVVAICSGYSVPVLVGAGIKNCADLRKSIELGARGVLIASGIVKSEDPVASLTSLISS